MNVYEKLLAVQTNVKAPKGNYSKFGDYNYRKCEDILEAAKPVLAENNCLILLFDDIKFVEGRFYVNSTAKFVDVESGEFVEVTAAAREEETKKGMDGSQVTGASSSYARKYALNGLLAIDDTDDSDVTNVGDKADNKPKEYKCADCGKKFETFTDKNGKTWSAGQVYHMAESKNADKKARCADCRKKYESEQK